MLFRQFSCPSEARKLLEILLKVDLQYDIKGERGPPRGEQQYCLPYLGLEVSGKPEFIIVKKLFGT